MKKQRWRKTKKVKWWACDGCCMYMKVNTKYEPEYCCNGYLCGCRGLPTNPIFCNGCVKKLFGEPVKKKEVNLNEFF